MLAAVSCGLLSPLLLSSHSQARRRISSNNMAASSSSSSSSFSSWACSRCTFLNPPTQKSSCQVCLTPSFPSSPSSAAAVSTLRWSCRACTFSNPSTAVACEVCGTRAAPSFTFCDLDPDPDELADPAIGAVFLPLQRCGSKRGVPPKADVTDLRVEKASRKEEEGEEEEEVVVVPSPVVASSRHSGSENHPTKPRELRGNVSPSPNRSRLKILSYNVWFREDLEVHRRMEALGNLIQQHSPDFICFQEVTPIIYRIFQNSNWWKEYKCSISLEVAVQRPYFCMLMSKVPVKAFGCKVFENSIMGRELCLADIDVGAGKKLVIATSHLESPSPAPPKWDQMYSKERVAQAKESINHLQDSSNVIFGGDMNWDDKLDGAFPLPDGWVDAWMELRPGENGWTYDTKANQMLSGNRKLQKRLDRFICNLQNFKIDSIEMIGMEAIPGLSYCKEKKVRNEYQKLMLPVLPSDHYGLLLTISTL